MMLFHQPSDWTEGKKEDISAGFLDRDLNPKAHECKSEVPTATSQSSLKILLWRCLLHELFFKKKTKEGVKIIKKK
jgi:hypothetical protein